MNDDTRKNIDEVNATTILENMPLIDDDIEMFRR